jgi:hypothetical protein
VNIVEYSREHGMLIRTWTHEGIECAMGRSFMVGVNGYVRVPEGIELPYDEYHLIDLDVHGGVTYGPDKDGWMGFDTGHAFDVWLDPDVPEDRYSRTMREAGIDNPNTMMDALTAGWTHIWTLEKLEAEVNLLAAQIYAMRRTE